jgi:hypothetical protein
MAFRLGASGTGGGVTSADLAAHAADTTDVHGFVNTGAAVLDTDTRLSDARTPLAGSVDASKVNASLKPSGTAVAATEALRALGTTSSSAAAGNHGHAELTPDQAAGVASVRTLGTGAQQAAVGSHTHAASAVTNAPTGSVTSTNVQAAINEVASRVATGNAFRIVRFSKDDAQNFASSVDTPVTYTGTSASANIADVTTYAKSVNSVPFFQAVVAGWYQIAATMIVSTAVTAPYYLYAQLVDSTGTRTGSILEIAQGTQDLSGGASRKLSKWLFLNAADRLSLFVSSTGTAGTRTIQGSGGNVGRCHFDVSWFE